MDNFYQFEEAMNKFKLKNTNDSTINEWIIWFLYYCPV